MARDFETFKDVVVRRSQFYESVDIKTVAVKKDSTWFNLHTDAHLRPETPDELSISEAEVLGPTAYFREVVSFENLWDLFEEMFGEEYSGYDEPVVFPGLSVEGGDNHWKENLYKTNYWDYNRAEDAYGIMVQSNVEDALIDRDNFINELRQLDPPYYDDNDLCQTFFGHTDYKWGQPRSRFFAPLYVQVNEHKLTESGNLELKIQSHDSIQGLTVSTWARKDRKIIDRALHNLTDNHSLEGRFHKFEIDWEIEGNPTDVSTSIFHTAFDEIRESSRLSSSVPFIALEAVLGKTGGELSKNLEDILITPNKQTLDNVGFADDFEATIITVFSLAGFSAFSPDWYDHLSDIGSLPDLIAYSSELEILLIGECTLADSDDKVKKKVNDALASAHTVKERFEKIDLLNLNVIPVCITPAKAVSPVGIPDNVELLTGPDLQEIKQEAEQSSDPKNILREWETYDQIRRFR